MNKIRMIDLAFEVLTAMKGRPLKAKLSLLRVGGNFKVFWFTGYDNYTIVDAINDGNVVPFRTDYVDTLKKKNDIKDKEVRTFDIEKAMGAPERVQEIVKYVLEHFDQKTRRNSYYKIGDKRMAGFNSIFVTSSIPMAMKYYTGFKRQLDGQGLHLTIATIFSCVANEDDPDDVLELGVPTTTSGQQSWWLLPACSALNGYCVVVLVQGAFCPSRLVGILSN